ncbi:Retrovirus-related Pol polyprotein from transposon RE1 [Vitis vinifera]|uniref:Retrovirus-related Pol polyprotein from transposon RE1 n=1 Tax=Vitis vinifera TaxID=29760 RepID=A0A438H3C8_VITVI|nr:Retrovirus-related Pol polyprotein from transposon RE1 [Vitis vinifera]
MDSAPLCVKFTGTNYSTWAFQFELFLKGKDLWGHIDGTDVEKPSTFDKSQDVGTSHSWAVLDARIMSWLLGSVEPHIVTHLRPHRSAQSMWAYLKKVYHQDNDARRFQLEHAIAMFQHGSLSIQDYYSAFLTLWHEYADLVTADVPIAALSTIQTIHATTRRDQFLMKLQQRLSTQAILEQSHGMFLLQGYGHIAATCPKKFCSYCKKKGHIIKECRIRPQNRQAQAFQTSVIVPPVATHDSPSAACSVPAPPAPDYCTPEMVQRILISALSAMGFQGNNSTKLWYVDSGASNHMTNNPTALCHVRPYAGQSSIQTANGSSLPIAAIGDASSKFTNVFLAPQLSTNLISVGQLVDNNCAVNFSGNGCVVQDQVTGKPIAKGPKVGRLFPLFLPVPDFSPRSSIKSFACNNVSDLSMVWHRRLGHPNTQILSHVLNSDLPGNKDRYSLSLECDSCKLGKSKTLPFPLHASRASHCFDLIHSDVWEPSPVSSHEKFKYYVTFIDDHSRFTWVYFLRSKSEVFRTFTEFLAYVDNQFSTSIKTLRTDSGGEYLSTEFQAFLASKFSDLHPVSSRFQPGIVYTRRSRPQSLSVAHPISDPTTLQMQSVAAPSIRRSSRVSVPPNRYGFPSSSSGNSISALTAALSKFDIPTCYSHAAKHDCWRQAMQEEIAALEANHTWDIEPCPPTIVPLGCKWVYSVKVRSDGSLDRYKARLVALGNNQEYGVNYEETFAPVAKMTTVRTILALAASSDWPLHQMDVKMLFFMGILKSVFI